MLTCGCIKKHIDFILSYKIALTTASQDPFLNLSTSFPIVLSDLFHQNLCPDGFVQLFIMRNANKNQ